MMQAKIYNKEGKESGKIDLPENLFGLKWNNDLVHQVLVSMQSNARVHLAHTKDRSEVRGGGRKPWRQKGTGRARHGSTRSPIWVGGGVTFGPRNEKNFKKKINKKMKTKALFTVLSKKLQDGEIIFVEDFSLDKPKTKEAKKLLDNLAKNFEKINYKTGKRVAILTPEKAEETIKSFANLKSAVVDEVRNANPLALLTYKYLVFVNPEKSLEIMSERGANVSVKKEVAKVSQKTTAKRKTPAKKAVLSSKAAAKRAIKPKK